MASGGNSSGGSGKKLKEKGKQKTGVGAGFFFLCQLWTLIS